MCYKTMSYTQVFHSDETAVLVHPSILEKERTLKDMTIRRESLVRMFLAWNHQRPWAEFTSQRVERQNLLIHVRHIRTYCQGMS
jgi:hypothetical protein